MPNGYQNSKTKNDLDTVLDLVKKNALFRVNQKGNDADKENTAEEEIDRVSKALRSGGNNCPKGQYWDETQQMCV